MRTREETKTESDNPSANSTAARDHLTLDCSEHGCPTDFELSCEHPPEEPSEGTVLDGRREVVENDPRVIVSCSELLDRNGTERGRSRSTAPAGRKTTNPSERSQAHAVPWCAG